MQRSPKLAQFIKDRRADFTSTPEKHDLSLYEVILICAETPRATMPADDDVLATILMTRSVGVYVNADLAVTMRRLKKDWTATSILDAIIEAAEAGDKLEVPKKVPFGDIQLMHAAL